MDDVRTMILTELAPLMRRAGKKLLVVGVAALGTKVAARHPLLTLAAGLAAVVFAIVCERLLGREPEFAAETT
jgi:hypothetical protein